MRESVPFRDTVLDWNIGLVSRRMLQNLELHDKERDEPWVISGKVVQEEQCGA
jgi:hypothetical protein